MDRRRSLRSVQIGSALGLAGLVIAAASVRPRRRRAAARASSAADARERRAIEAAIWGMPIVSFDAMREAFFRDAGARYGDVVYWSEPADWRTRFTTPNGSSLYVYFNFNTKDGPVVLDFPPAAGAGLFGSILDAWQSPLVDVGPRGEDQGRGARYVIVPPGYAGAALPEESIAVRPATYNGYALFRAIPESPSSADLEKALALVKKLRLHVLGRATTPPETRFVDMAGKLFDGIPRYDASFYGRLARMVDEEPVLPRDVAIMGQLATIGIEKGRGFQPDRETRAAMERGVERARAAFVEDNAGSIVPWWPGTHWGLSRYVGAARRSKFTFEEPGGLDLDSRAAFYFLACAPPARLGEASFYVAAFEDGAGEPFEGDRHYRLRVPPNVPASQFWSLTIYDIEDAAFFRGAARVTLDSYDRSVRHDADGSVEIDIGPTAPAGRESNFVPTLRGKRWFAFFRFYGPGSAVSDKSWRMGDIEALDA
jgi:hypothetical protein